MVPKTGDSITDEKAAHISLGDRYKFSGVVLRSSDGSRCIVELGAVRWLTNEEWWRMMLPTEE